MMGIVLTEQLSLNFDLLSFKYRNTLQIKKNTDRFAHVPFDFITFYLFVLTFYNEIERCQS